MLQLYIIKYPDIFRYCIIKYIIVNIGFLIRLIITYYIILNYNLKAIYLK